MALEDDFALQKSAAEYIYRQLREADEANLVHEEGCLDLSLSGESAFFFLIQCADRHHWILVVYCSYVLLNSVIFVFT